MYLLVYYLFEHFCMFFQIPSTFMNLRRFFKRLPPNQTLVASYLDLYLVQTFWHARLRLQDLNESGGIHHCWEVWFWRSQLRLSLRLNAKIIALLSYFIFPLSLQTLDRTRGQGHGVTRHAPVTRCWPVNGRYSSWHNLLYFVRMMNSLLPDRRVPIVSMRGVLFLLLPPSQAPGSHH